jgi:hypothetical protein
MFLLENCCQSEPKAQIQIKSLAQEKGEDLIMDVSVALQPGVINPKTDFLYLALASAVVNDDDDKYKPDSQIP